MITAMTYLIDPPGVWLESSCVDPHPVVAAPSDPAPHFQDPRALPRRPLHAPPSTSGLFAGANDRPGLRWRGSSSW